MNEQLEFQKKACEKIPRMLNLGKLSQGLTDMALRAKTKLACEIAQIESTKLSDAIKAGHFNCLPETRAGASRIFEIEDIVALRIYAFLTTNMRMSAQRAGRIACDVKTKCAHDAQFVTIAYDQAGRSQISNGYLGENLIPGGHSDRGFTMVFGVGDIRRYVIEHLEYERKNMVLGDD